MRHWHRCDRWRNRQMACPQGGKAGSSTGGPHRGPSDPRGPGWLDRAVDWYVDNVNISRHIGWKHGPPPKPFMWLYEFINEPTKGKALDFDSARWMNQIMEELVKELVPATPMDFQMPTATPALRNTAFDVLKGPRYDQVEETLAYMFGQDNAAQQGEQVGAWLDPHMDLNRWSDPDRDRPKPYRNTRPRGGVSRGSRRGFARGNYLKPRWGGGGGYFFRAAKQWGALFGGHKPSVTTNAPKYLKSFKQADPDL